MKNDIMANGYRLKVIAFVLFVLSPFAIMMAQSDSVLNRSVTVERDFQPVIQAAGKISTQPVIKETKIDPTPVEYSYYTADVTPAPTFNPLLSQPTRFEPGKAYNGYIRGGLGHTNTLFDFGYHLDDGKKSILDVYAHHKAQWGLRALSKTIVGMEFKHPFPACDLYFGVNGGNIYYHRYGHFYEFTLSDNTGAWVNDAVLYPKPRTITARDETSLWTVEAFIGVRANAKQDLQYRVQTGYKLFSKPGAVSEHQIRTHLDFDWHREAHHVGAQVYVQNNILQLGGNLATTILPEDERHSHDIRFEPYYAYHGKRLRLHAGVNLDFNIGTGPLLTNSDNFSFAPSPHVNLEAQIAKNWLTIYADVRGELGLCSLQEFMEENRYRRITDGITDAHAGSYTPVDGEVGFHIRPYRDLLIELHGGYAYMLNQTVLIANTSGDMMGDFNYRYADYQRGKVGGKINYHFRDVVRIHVNGDFYFWGGKTPVYDRPGWEVGVRVDGRIDQHWSLYSENAFAGNRLVLAVDNETGVESEHVLRPTVNLNLGVQYEMLVGKRAKAEQLKIKEDGSQILRPESPSNLVFFFQLNNWLHRKNDIYYGYRTEGINFLLGATFRF